MSYIDALRGLACIWVLIHHSLEHKPADSGWFFYPFRIIVYLANTGWLGVSLFLVLSGFCLTYPLALKYPITDVQLNNKEFFQRRLRRILPPYYAALGLTLFLLFSRNVVKHQSFAGLEDSFPLKEFSFDLFSHIFMLHNLFVKTFGTINPAFWSLALEAQLYLIFPILLLIAKKRGLWSILFLTLVVSVGWQFMAFRQTGLSIYWTPEYATIYHALPGRCFEFAAGMVAAYLVAHPVANQNRYALTILGILILPLSYLVLFVSRFGPGLDPLWGIIFACLLVTLNHLPEKWFIEIKILSYLTWLGGISYSIYLIHSPIFSVLRLNIENDFILTVVAAVRILIVIALAYGFYLAFEKPFIKKKTSQAKVSAPELDSVTT